MSELAIPRFGSIRESDPDYDPLLVRIGCRIEVLLDGTPVSKVIAYSRDDGWIRRLVTDDMGKVRVVAARAPFVGEETLLGRVTTRWR